MDDPLIIQAKVMQVATLHNDRPWICSVYFVKMDNAFYWLSEPHRKHSQDVSRDGRVAMAIVGKTDMPVVGLQASGVAEEVSDTAEVEKVMERYSQKYGVGKGFHERFTKGINKHRLFRFHPDTVQLFDERA